jgi:hypothetical protein
MITVQSTNKYGYILQIIKKKISIYLNLVIF